MSPVQRDRLESAQVQSSELSDLLKLCAIGIDDETPALVTLASSAFAVTSRAAESIATMIADGLRP